MHRVIIDRNAFQVMVTSSLEVYKKEAFGYVYGERKKDDFLVHAAMPLQTAERGYEEVSRPSRMRDKRMRSLDELMGAVIGDFHSHPNYGKANGPEHASPSDKRLLAETTLYDLSIIVGINQGERRREWEHNCHRVYGTIKIAGRAYKISISADCSKGKEIEVAKVFVKGLNGSG